eukprot:COSAG05_NODE_1464_length_4807_cov_1081.654630_4_plen_143_part_00
MAQINFEAKLSSQDRFAIAFFTNVHLTLSYVARDSGHHAALMPCSEALLWTSGNGVLALNGTNIADYAAVTCVSLLGQNEGGLTLSSDTINNNIVDGIHDHFDVSSQHWLKKARSDRPAKKVVGKIQVVVDMVIAGERATCR